MAPLVSVIVPNFNHARFLPRRVESVLAQTFRDFELIAMDDASTDNSREVLAGYAKQTPMRLVINEENSGSPFIQWRRGAQLAAGKYLWIAESDDYADSRLLERLVSEMLRHPSVGLAYCQSFNVGERDEILGSCKLWTRDLHSDRWNHDFVNQGRDEVARYLVQLNTIPNASAVLVRKDLLLQSCRHVNWMRLCGDWLTWSRVLMRADVAFVAEPLNYFRSHARSVRDTTTLALWCLEELCIKGYICSQVPASTGFLFKRSFARIGHLHWRIGKHIARRTKRKQGR